MVSTWFILISGSLANAQNKNLTDSLQYFNLDQCIVYALTHQPEIMQASLNLAIAKKTNSINLSAWLPQVTLQGNFTHYLQQPTIFAVNTADPGGPPVQVHSGVVNTFNPQISATQKIFSPEVFYAAKTAHLYVQQALQSDDSTKINLVATVSKSFYNVLFTQEQIRILKDDTVRLGKNLRDAYHQYIGGIVDKTDYKEAFISLNNSRAQLKQANESLRPQYSALKQSMGFPPEKEFNVQFDTLQMMKEVAIDTTLQIQYDKRIEYQLLQTAKDLQQQDIKYQRWQFIPTASALYNYTYEFENNTLSNIFNKAYPNSFIGASLSIPIFTGWRRKASIERSKLQLQKIDWAEFGLKSRIFTEYTTAMANYRSNLADLKVLQDNVVMAKDVYGVVSLQYKQGVVAYLNVITAESNLFSSEISYINSLFKVLLSKVDLEKAMGVLSKY